MVMKNLTAVSLRKKWVSLEAGISAGKQIVA